MFRLSIPVRHALAKITLPVLIAVAFCMMLLGKADAVLASRARMAMADALVPIYGVLATPIASVHGTISDLRGLWSLRSENARLRTDNEKLRAWQAVANALAVENESLKRELNWVPDPAPSRVTARVVADAGGVYARSVLLFTGPNAAVQRGEIAMDGAGLVGRVTELGARSARVLLITDLNSRIPVMLETSRARAMLAGTNGPRPRLMYWPEGQQPAEGDRVVTSAEAGVFPAGLPVGTVHLTSGGVPEVEPSAHLDRLEEVRIFDYGLRGALLPDLPARTGDRPAERRR